MSHVAVTLEALLADFNETARRWRTFFDANPAAAGTPTDIARSTTVAELVWHIYGTAYRHSERLLNLPVTDLEGANPVKSLDAAWDLHATAADNLAYFLANIREADLDKLHTFTTRSGVKASGTARKLCLHAFVHSIRHWAQIGPLVRQHGYPPEFGQDIFFSRSIR